MQHDVYDYTNPAMGVQRSSVLRKTYGLLAVSFIPCALGAFAAAATGFNLFSLTGNRWAGIIAFFAFFYGMVFLIEKNRYSNVGAGLLMVFTFPAAAIQPEHSRRREPRRHRSPDDCGGIRRHVGDGAKSQR